MLGCRGFELESAAGRICREAGDGSPPTHRRQLAVDTTLVCALHCDGYPHNGAADVDGVVLQAARRRKERTYPEMVGPRTRARLVVLAVEVGGR